MVLENSSSKNISFIVIGRNEEEHLAQNFKSIRKVCTENQIVKYEIVYVDSDSTDNSIEIALKHDVETIVKITEFYNAAVARNTGANYANAENLIFLDGDMELIAIDPIVLNRLDFNTCIIRIKWIENIIDNDKVVKSYVRSFPDNLCGGAFVISKQAYKNIGGMDPRLKKGQDYDLFIRANKMRMKIIDHKDFICEHNMEGYRSPTRIDTLPVYSSKYRSYLFKKNIDSLISHKLILMEFYPLVAFFVLIILLAMFSSSLSALIIPPTIFFSAIIYKNRNNLKWRNINAEIKRQIYFLYFFFKTPHKGDVKIDVVKRTVLKQE